MAHQDRKSVPSLYMHEGLSPQPISHENGEFIISHLALKLYLQIILLVALSFPSIITVMLYISHNRAVKSIHQSMLPSVSENKVVAAPTPPRRASLPA